MTPYAPLPHQESALDNVINHPNGLLNQDRVQYISACGTGKTLVLLWAVERYLKSLNQNNEIKNNVIVFLFPSLTLINQSYDSYKNNNTITGYNPLVVCSDSKVGSSSDDEEDTPENCLFDVSTDLIQIQKYLEDKSISNKVIFSTYKSSPLVGEALKNTHCVADITVFDEAHRTAIYNQNSSGRTRTVKNNSGFALDDAKFPSKKRLFATATPRMYSFRDNFYEMNRVDKGDVAYSMDNPLLYGKIAHEYSMRQAIEDGVITDYKILAIAVNAEDIIKFLKPKYTMNQLNVITQDQQQMEEIAKMLAIKNAYDRYGIKNAIVFNSTIEDSKNFVRTFSSLMDETIAVSHVDGSMNNEQRKAQIDILRSPDKAMLSNAKLLSEGHDVPEADFVVFNNKTESKTDIVQRVGRVQRRDSNNPDKIGYILLPIFVNDVNQDIEESLRTNEGLRTLFSTVTALKESDTQLRDWIATRKRIREQSAFNDQDEETDNKEDRKIIFTDITTLQGQSFKTSNTNDDKQYIKLMKEWEDKIEAIIVGETENSQRWYENANLLEEYIKEFGELPKTNTIYKDKLIGSWLNDQRKTYKNNTLTQDRIDRLMAIDEDIFKSKIEYDNEQWNSMRTLLGEYVKEFGELPIFNTVYKDKNIGTWTYTQKENYKKDILSQDRIDRLMAIDENIFKSKLEYDNEQWNSMRTLLEEYIKEFGELPKQSTIYENKNIGIWLFAQKTSYKNNTLSQDRIDRLMAIDEDIFGNTHEIQWNSMCTLLEEYVKEFGELPKTNTIYKDKLIGKWLSTQKQHHKDNILSKDRIDRLMAIDEDILGDMLEIQWNSMCTLLEEYVKEFGELPSKRTIYKDKLIGTWLRRQKNANNSNTLSQDRIDRLMAIDSILGSAKAKEKPIEEPLTVQDAPISAYRKHTRDKERNQPSQVKSTSKSVFDMLNETWEKEDPEIYAKAKQLQGEEQPRSLESQSGDVHVKHHSNRKRRS